MKKLLLILLCLPLLFSSCSKCVDCNCDPSAPQYSEICQNDFYSKEDFNTAVAMIEEDFGCECK